MLKIFVWVDIYSSGKSPIFVLLDSMAVHCLFLKYKHLRSVFARKNTKSCNVETTPLKSLLDRLLTMKIQSEIADSVKSEDANRITESKYRGSVFLLLLS